MQTLIVLAIIAVAGLFLLRRAYGAWSKSRTTDGCASDCGCSSADKTPKSWDTTSVV